MTPSLSGILEAAIRIRPFAHKTPVLTSRTLDERVNAQVFLKCENFQKVGAFKFRGACNAVLSLDAKEKTRGVVTHSSGNHAQALALAGQSQGIAATIVMPSNAPHVKVDAVRGYGAEIVFCEPNLTARETTAAEIVEQTGATLIHAYDDIRIIHGQGTAAMELIDQVGQLDMVIVPVGGGGLLSGTALATAGLCPEAKIVGAEPSGADDAFRSLQEGRIIPSVDPQTIADGLLTSLGETNFPIIQELVSQIVTVDEETIVESLRFVLMRMKIVIEPSAAVAVAALMSGKMKIAGKRVGVILSGGNLDLGKLATLGKEKAESRTSNETQRPTSRDG